MSSIPKFDSEIYSEELHSVTESEYDEVMADNWQGYTEWSTEVEADAWRGSKPVANVLIKKAWCATRRESGMSERFTTTSSIAHIGGR